MSLAASQLSGSVLFTDLVGFTEYTDARGDDAALDVLDRQRKLIDSVLAAQPDSRLVKELGDGLMVWSPTGPGALACGITFAADIRTARESGGFPLAVRLGIHHGPVVERGEDIVGQTVNLAARICALAAPSEILISDEVMTACGSDIDGSRAVGPVSLKGVADPVWLYRVA